MKKSFVILLSMMFLLTSCASMLKNAVKNETFMNKIFIHDNPKIGDYAKLESVMHKDNPQANMMGKSFVEMKIIAINNSEITTSYKITNTGMMAMVGNLEFEFVTDEDGNVRKAFLVEGSSKTKLKIAQPGDKNYNSFQEITNEELQRYQAETKIKVPAGTFNCKIFHFNDSKKPNSKTIFYYSKDAKFGHVASSAVIEKDGKYEIKPGLVLIQEN